MKKSILLILTCLLLFQVSSVFAIEGLGVSIGAGQAKDDIDIYRIGMKMDFHSRFFETGVGFLSGYYEVSLNHWDHALNNVTALAVSPVFVYYFGDPGSLQPYIEAGIGAAFLSDTRIGHRDMSTKFQFEDRVGLGVKYDRLNIAVRYMHYSNAGIKKPNDGIDIFMISASLLF